MNFYLKAFENYRLTDIPIDMLRVVTSGHVTKTLVKPFDPPYSKTLSTRKRDGSICSELWAIEVYIVGLGTLDVFGSCALNLEPMTLI